MKILFIRHHSVSDEIIPPLHFGYLASSLSQNHRAKIYDQLRDKLSDNLLMDYLLRENPDIIGLSAYTKDIHQVKALMYRIKQLLPGARTVLGGVQMSLMPRETFKHLGRSIDFGFAGESELAFSRFIEAVNEDKTGSNLEEVPNLVWRCDGNIKINTSHFSEDLDDLPFPSWELMPPNGYPKAPHGAFYRQFPVAPIITSRGCPYPCTFCAAGAIAGKKVRYRTIDNVMEEVKYLVQRMGVNEIHIEDDNFSMKKDRVIEFCESILSENLGMTWSLPNGMRLNNLDLSTLKLMRKSGCYAVNIGIESGNDRILEKIKKQISKNEIKAQISMAKEAGLDIGGFFIIGFPDETVDEIKDTIRFAGELALDRIGISYFQPFPGTMEYSALQNSGEHKLNLDKSILSLHTISFVPKNFTRRKLRLLRLWGFIRFYFRLKILIKLFSEVKSIEHLKFILKRGLRWLST